MIHWTFLYLPDAAISDPSEGTHEMDVERETLILAAGRRGLVGSVVLGRLQDLRLARIMTAV